jgi:ketol-acid reductoisomerase
LTDAECIQRLVDTGFIVQNKNIRDKTIYAKTRTANAPKIYKELLKMIDDGERAKRIMLNNISGVEAGLKEYLFRLAKSNKEQHSVRIRNIRLPR